MNDQRRDPSRAAEGRLIKGEGHILIGGTGRCGTTLLVQLFTLLNFDTGFSKETALRKVDQLSHGGLDQRRHVEPENLPYVAKGPRLADRMAEFMNKNLRVECAILPMRHLYGAAESRRHVYRTAIELGEQRRPGGLWKTKIPELQEVHLALAFYNFLYPLVANNVPVYQLDFPRFATDVDYLYQTLKPIFDRHHVEYEAVAEVHRGLVNRSFIHEFSAPPDWQASNGLHQLEAIADQQSKLLERLERKFIKSGKAPIQTETDELQNTEVLKTDIFRAQLHRVQRKGLDGARIVFFMRNWGYMRNFSSVIRLLAERGHRIRVVFDTPKVTDTEKAALSTIEQLKSPPFGVEFDELAPPEKRGNLYRSLTIYIRLCQDYLRYLDQRYAKASKLRERAASRLPRGTLAVLSLVGRSSSLAASVMRRILNLTDRLIPPPAYVLDYLRKEKVDLVMVTPLFSLGPHQPDYLKAARHFKIPTCLPVASWDNMTNKGLIHVPPDRVLVWNEYQRKEAVELHGLASGQVTVTGAYCYDHWFAWKPSTTKESFLDKVGLDPSQPFILFLGSSPFIAPDEVPVVRRWALALRNSRDPLLSQVGILIRPHPQNAAAWAEADLLGLGNIKIYPEAGANPVDKKAKSDYYDSMYHSRIVVGANTSGMVEASILGKPVHTVLLDEWADTQEGTIHFNYLTSVSGGLLHVARDLDEHATMVGKALRDPDQPCIRSRSFVSGFIRPADLMDTPGETFVNAVEELAERAVDIEKGQSKLGSLILFLRRAVCAPLLLFSLPGYWRGLRGTKTKKSKRHLLKSKTLKNTKVPTRKKKVHSPSTGTEPHIGI